MAIRTIKVWGNNIDLASARKWFARYLSNYYGFNYINTTNYTKAQRKAAVISKEDIIVGGIRAGATPNNNKVTGVGTDFKVPKGTLRLWGQHRVQTDIEIEKWSIKEKARLDAEAEATKPKAPPAAPKMPSPITKFDQPMPTFSDDIQNVYKFSYYFGLDKVQASVKNINQNVCFISQDITIGELKEGEYIQLDAKYITNESSSIEFYILDAGRVEPILSISDKKIFNEKIFYNLRPRFAIDLDKEINIKKNGMSTNITIDQAIKSNNGLYTISYSPVNAYNYAPISTTIKVKVIIRLYDKTAAVPYITKMKIRKYGGNALWKDDISLK